MFKDSTEDFVGVPVSKFPHEARKYLSAFDRNGDGMIDLGELEHAARTIEEARRGNLTVDMFPERLRATVRALDDEGDGVLEIDEIAEMVEMYAALKEANKNGEISIATLPKEIQPTLKVFDVDGDGTVAPMELARGAELYIESKKTVKKLTRLSVALLLLMGVMLAAITGLVFAVIELSKETTVSADGVTTVKGSTEAQKSGSLSLDPARDGAVLLDAPLERVNDVGGRRRLLDEHPLARVDRTKLHHTTRRILSEQGPSEVLVAVLQEAYIKTTCQTVKTLGSVLDIPFTTKGGVQNTLSISSMRCESLEGTGQANTVGGNEGKNYLLNCPNDETRPGECGIYLVQTPEEVDRRRHLLSQYRAPLSLSNDGTTWEFNVSNGHYDVLNDYDNNPPQTTVFQTDASVCTREVFDQDCEERTNDACMCFGGGSSKFDQNTMCYRGLGRLQGETEDKIMCKTTFNQGIWDGMSAELWHTPCHLRTPQECEYYYDLGAMAEEWWEMGDPNSDFAIIPTRWLPFGSSGWDIEGFGHWVLDSNGNKVLMGRGCELDKYYPGECFFFRTSVASLATPSPASRACRRPWRSGSSRSATACSARRRTARSRTAPSWTCASATTTALPTASRTGRRASPCCRSARVPRCACRRRTSYPSTAAARAPPAPSPRTSSLPRATSRPATASSRPRTAPAPQQWPRASSACRPPSSATRTTSTRARAPSSSTASSPPSLRSRRGR